ncbi:hypothetical protein ABI017_14720, partial [Enterococcus faecium]
MSVTDAAGDGPLVPLDPAWPRLSVAAADALLTAPGQRLEMETIDIRGVPTRVWKNAPPHLAALVQHTRSHGERVFAVYEDDRVTYEANYRA